MTTPTRGLRVALGHLAVETGRPTSRDPEPGGNTGRQGRTGANTGGDSPAILAGASSRVGRRQLARLASELTDRDRTILEFLDDYRFATSGQLARLFAPNFTGPRSATRQLNRQMTKLADSDLLRRLERRVGGVRAGSSSSIWTLTTAGRKLAHQQGGGLPEVSRARLGEPSISFLDHTLAVTELRVRLAELTHDGRLASVHSLPEPACWRRYVGRAGQPAWLKPDLAVVTGTADGFEDHWFIEADRATENPARIVTKCRQYQDYRTTGREQADTGVFPAVVWVTPDARRRDQLAERLASERDIVHGLFHIVALNDFEDAIKNGPQEPESPSDKP
jgi:Replication-relaxation